MSVIWMIAAGNAGMHLAVAPATEAYRACVESKGSASVAKYTGSRTSIGRRRAATGCLTQLSARWHRCR